MQMVSAIRIRLREGDDRHQAVAFAVRIVGTGVRAGARHGATRVQRAAAVGIGLIRTFGLAGAIATFISFVAVILVLPILGVMLIRNEAALAKDRTPADALMDGLGTIVGGIVDHVVKRPYLYSLIGVALFGRSRRPSSICPRATASPTRCPIASRRSMRRAASTRSSPAPIPCTS